MDELIKQAKDKGDWALVIHLHYLDYIMDTLIDLNEAASYYREENNDLR